MICKQLVLPQRPEMICSVRKGESRRTPLAAAQRVLRECRMAGRPGGRPGMGCVGLGMTGVVGVVGGLGGTGGVGGLGRVAGRRPTLHGSAGTGGHSGLAGFD